MVRARQGRRWWISLRWQGQQLDQVRFGNGVRGAGRVWFGFSPFEARMVLIQVGGCGVRAAAG